MKIIVFFIVLQFSIYSLALKESSNKEFELKTLQLEKKVENIEKHLNTENTNISNQYAVVLEKTNNQLSMWANPYGVMVATLSALFSFLAIGVAFVLFKQSSDHKKQVKEEQSERDKQFQSFLSSSSQAIESMNQKNIADSKAEYDKLITEKLENLTNAKPDETVEIKKQLEELKKDRAKIASDMSQTVMANWPTMSSIAMLGGGPQVHKCGSCSFGFRVKNLSNRGFITFRTSDLAEVTCPKCGNIDLV